MQNRISDILTYFEEKVPTANEIPIMLYAQLGAVVEDVQNVRKKSAISRCWYRILRLQAEDLFYLLCSVNGRAEDKVLTEWEGTLEAYEGRDITYDFLFRSLGLTDEDDPEVVPRLEKILDDLLRIENRIIHQVAFDALPDRWRYQMRLKSIDAIGALNRESLRFSVYADHDLLQDHERHELLDASTYNKDLWPATAWDELVPAA